MQSAELDPPHSFSNSSVWLDCERTLRSIFRLVTKISYIVYLDHFNFNFRRMNVRIAPAAFSADSAVSGFITTPG